MEKDVSKIEENLTFYVNMWYNRIRTRWITKKGYFFGITK